MADPEARPLAVEGLDGWTVQLGEPPDLPPGPWTWDDGLGTLTRRLPGPGERVLLSVDGFAQVLVDVPARRIHLHDVAIAQPLAEAWVRDQIAPRILGYLGQLVVHAGAVLVPGRGAVLLLAPSLHGKSTLVGFLHREGWTLLSDDAAVLRLEGDRAVVRSTRPRLRLRPDSLAHLYAGQGRVPSPGWQSVVDDAERGAVPEGHEHPLLAAFHLTHPDPSPVGCRAEPLAPAGLCIELLTNDYTLDPPDRTRAAARLARAAAVANAVPGFALSYPRDFARLPDVRATILDALARAGGSVNP